MLSQQQGPGTAPANAAGGTAGTEQGASAQKKTGSSKAASLVEKEEDRSSADKAAAGAASSIAAAEGAAAGGGRGRSQQQQFGLQGILKVIRMTDPDSNVLALGTDLTSLGLNLNSSDCLYSSFVSPLCEAPAFPDLEEVLPTCFVSPSPIALKAAHLTKVKDSTLLYIFYASPRLLIQGCAALELYDRQWRYHQYWRQWFKLNPASKDGALAVPDNEATPGGLRSEAGESAAKTEVPPAGITAATSQTDGSGDQWIWFDVANWQEVAYNGAISPECFLSQREIRQSVEAGMKDAESRQTQQQQQMQQLHQEHQMHVSQQQQVSQLQGLPPSAAGLGAAPAAVGGVSAQAPSNLSVQNGSPPSAWLGGTR